MIRGRWRCRMRVWMIATCGLSPIQPGRRHGQIGRFGKAVAEGADLVIDAKDLVADGQPASCPPRWARPDSRRGSIRPSRPFDLATQGRSCRPPRGRAWSIRRAAIRATQSRNRRRNTAGAGSPMRSGRRERGLTRARAVEGGAPKAPSGRRHFAGCNSPCMRQKTVHLAAIALRFRGTRPYFVRISSVSAIAGAPFTITRDASIGKSTNKCNFILTFY